MYRNLYDSDVTTWSPQGRLHQVEYATEAVSLGTAALGVRSRTHVVLTGLKRSLSTLAGFNPKLFPVAKNCGVTFSGIAADAKYLAEFMRRECLTYNYVFGEERPHPLSELVQKVGSKSQVNTQKYGRRPYGAGLIVAGVDGTGPHVFELWPSGNVGEAYAVAIGGRSQAARSYLEKNYKEFDKANREELIVYALRALAACMHNLDQKLTAENVALAVVGEDEPWKEFEGAELEDVLAKYAAAEAAAAPAEPEAAPMED